MPKAGMFAGEVTQSAPADNAPTNKDKGYVWMEYGSAGGSFIPVTTDYSGGIAATQSNYRVTNPNFRHPFEGEAFTEFTMSAICQCTLVPEAGEVTDCVMFNFHEGGGGILMEMVKVDPGVIKFGASLESRTAPGQVSAFLSTLGGEVTHGVSDWYWVAMSYRSSDGAGTFAITDLDKGTESTVAVSDGLNNSIDFEADSDTKQGSVVNWGFELVSGAGPYIVGKQWTGYLSQILIHNKYIDLSVAANRRKFCSLDGVIDYGVDGSIPFSEQPLIYCSTGHPSSNTGSRFVGVWQDDFYISDDPVTVGLLPPVGTP